MRKPNSYLGLDHDFIRSDVVVALSARGKALILTMADRYNGRNNGSIPYSVKEAMAWLHCSPIPRSRPFEKWKPPA